MAERFTQKKFSLYLMLDWRYNEVISVSSGKGFGRRKGRNISLVANVTGENEMVRTYLLL